MKTETASFIQLEIFERDREAFLFAAKSKIFIALILSGWVQFLQCWVENLRLHTTWGIGYRSEPIEFRPVLEFMWNSCAIHIFPFGPTRWTCRPSLLPIPCLQKSPSVSYARWTRDFNVIRGELMSFSTFLEGDKRDAVTNLWQLFVQLIDYEICHVSWISP